MSTPIVQPRRDPLPPAMVGPATALSDGRTIRVLVVEDNTDHRLLIERALAGPAITVVGVATGAEAERLLPYVDLVLLDHGLPDTTGIDLLQHIHEIPNGPSAILVTGSDSTETVVDALRHGAVDYVTKRHGYLATLPDIVMRAWRQHDIAMRSREVQRLALLVHRAGDAEGVADEIVTGARRLLRASECILAVDSGDGWTVQARIGESADAPQLLDRIPQSVPPPGQVEVIDRRHIIVALAHTFHDQRGALVLLDVNAPLQEELDLAQTFAAFAATALDNVRRRETEQQLIAELQSTVEARRDFIASISHELRTPLTSINGYAETLMTRWGDLNEQLRSSCISRIRSNGAELSRLVEQLIDIASHERGREFDVRAQDVVLNEHVREIVGNLGDVLEGRTVEVEGTPVTAHVDTTLLRRALSNLLTNAVKYSGPDDPVRVRIDEQDGMAVVSVIDRGIGMDERDVGHIFEPFWRSRRAVSNAVRGSGIGLALVQQYVRAMGGSISVSSRLGKGSTFSLHLPVS